MAYVNKNICRYWRLFPTVSALALVVLMGSCSVPEKKPELPEKQKIALEPRASLLMWHDVTHKSYYGLKGPVKLLVIKPVVLTSESDQVVSDEWEIGFNPRGRVTSKLKRSDGVTLKTLYSYSEQGDLTFVASYEGEKLWRTSGFVYENGELIRIDFSDKKSGEQQTVKVSRQAVTDGWIEIQKPITSPGLPMYSQFLNDNALIWSNRGDINNGLDELYYIRTVDSVTSSSVENTGTVYMQGRGGYRYVYQQDGLLKAVESYNAHANRLFHRTSYRYSDLALLVSEKREVTDTSPFSQAIDESVDYHYSTVDKFGNWTRRTLTVTSKFQTQKFLESREISYFQ